MIFSSKDDCILYIESLMGDWGSNSLARTIYENLGVDWEDFTEASIPENFMEVAEEADSIAKTLRQGNRKRVENELLEKWNARIEHCCKYSDEDEELGKMLRPIAVATRMCIRDLESYLKESE